MNEGHNYGVNDNHLAAYFGTVNWPERTGVN